MLYLLLKWLHILSATVLMGTGIGIAFFMLIAHLRQDVAHIAQTARTVVIADTVFTAPAAIVQLVTGLGLVHLMGLSLTTGWIFSALWLYFAVGACWLPVLWLQLKMRNLAMQAAEENQPMPNQYYKYTRYWIALGCPAFIMMLIIFYCMVFKELAFT
ncbi:DUF2269 domain-containing protein [Pseudomonas sp. F1_0610]|uniref:DUF2269 family protein n=1 Tax=Pseudomonas sp. F1_0610 TaxID=3114284 RepID=UPI0039C16A2A